MAEIKLTAEQKAVVEHRGSALLVSAAAGSGKTKVLVDRVLKQVCEDSRNVDDFLMITFTQAAAAELRGKLIDRLSEQLSLTPDDRHLQKQLSRVYLAQISTVHAFCGTLLREYAHALDLPADFRIADEQETRQLRDRAMSQVIDALCAPDQSDEIIDCLNMLGTGRNEKLLSQLVEKVYLALQCQRDPDAHLAKLRQSLSLDGSADLGQTIWGKYLIDIFHADTEEACGRMERAIQQLQTEASLAKYLPVFLENLSLIRKLSAATTWSELSAIPFDFGRLPVVKNCPAPELQERVKRVRTTLIKELRKKAALFSISPNGAIGDLKKCASALNGLLTACADFSERYRREKLSRHILDYNDLEHETLRLIYGRGQTPTSHARQISERYAEIMIDEYQDTNAVQDAIFSGISRDGTNLFFVGDVKQSIYRFRMADPKIFLDKYHTYADYRTAQAGDPVRIFLSDNFRSHPEILSAANAVFRLTMTPRVGGLYYTDLEALHPRLHFAETGHPAVELHCVNIDNESTAAPLNRDEAEAEFVAAKIEQMLREPSMIPVSETELRPVCAEDIVILLRSLSSKAPVYLSALRRHSIRCVCSGDDLFATDEVEFLMALLQVLDNPHQDIPLVTALMSPPFGFTAEAMALLRAGCRDGDLYDALKQSSEYGDCLQTLHALRKTAHEGDMRRLLDEAEQRLHLRAIYGAMDGGEQRCRNLTQFVALADRYENGERYGLSSFLQYLFSLREKGLGGETEQAAGAVRLMTMHKSKGLEFPVVFLADLSKQFNTSDSTDPVLVDPLLGIGSVCYDPETRVSYPTIARIAISDHLVRESISEELRVLYVAMTRAKCRMIMTCCSAGLERRLKTLSELLDEGVSVSERAKSMGDWVLMTALTRTEAGELFSLADPPECRSVSEHPWLIRVHRAAPPAQGSNVSHQDAQAAVLLPFRPLSAAHTAAETAPSKLTATQLKGRKADEEISQETSPPPVRFDKPSFGQKSLSPTERGTAIHLAMQYLRYENCGELSAICEELERLVRQKFLTRLQAEAVDPKRIAAFFASDLGKRVLSAPQRIREFKFSVLKDAGTYDPLLAGEQVLLQGVTDCCLVEEDGLVILDFKSDRIRPGQESARAEEYRGQLEAYTDALSEVFSMPVKSRVIWFFATDSAYYL